MYDVFGPWCKVLQSQTDRFFFIYFIIYVFGEEAEWCWWWDSLHFNKTLCWKEIQKQTKLKDHVFNCSCS